MLDEQMEEVQRVLAEIGAGDVPQILVFNKLDRMEETERPRVLADSVELPGGARVPRVFVSALTGEGLRRCCAQRIADVAGADAGIESAAAGRTCERDDARRIARPAMATRRRTGTYHSHA